jgi:hypothetical protein
MFPPRGHRGHRQRARDHRSVFLQVFTHVARWLGQSGLEGAWDGGDGEGALLGGRNTS